MTYIYAPTQEYPFTPPQIREAFPNTSFPRETAARDAAFAERGYHYVRVADQPAYDPATHKVVKHTAPALVDGTWTLGWDVVALSQEELAARLAAWREATSVTPRQMRLALLDLGLLDDIEAMIPNLPRAVRIEWEYSVLLERRNPQWDMLGAVMTPPKTPEDIDGVFALALTKG
jgi:hypothetical protein